MQSSFLFSRCWKCHWRAHVFEKEIIFKLMFIISMLIFHCTSFYLIMSEVYLSCVLYRKKLYGKENIMNSNCSAVSILLLLFANFSRGKCTPLPIWWLECNKKELIDVWTFEESWYMFFLKKSYNFQDNLVFRVEIAVYYYIRKVSRIMAEYIMILKIDD